MVAATEVLLPVQHLNGEHGDGSGAVGSPIILTGKKL